MERSQTFLLLESGLGWFQRATFLKWLEQSEVRFSYCTYYRSVFSQPLLARTWRAGVTAFVFPRHCEGSDLESSKWFRSIIHHDLHRYPTPPNLSYDQRTLPVTFHSRRRPKEESISCLYISYKKNFHLPSFVRCNLRIASEHTSQYLKSPPTQFYRPENPNKYYSSFPTPSPNPSTPP